MHGAAEVVSQGRVHSTDWGGGGRAVLRSQQRSFHLQPSQEAGKPFGHSCNLHAVATTTTTPEPTTTTTPEPTKTTPELTTTTTSEPTTTTTPEPTTTTTPESTTTQLAVQSPMALGTSKLLFTSCELSLHFRCEKEKKKKRSQYVH